LAPLIQPQSRPGRARQRSNAREPASAFECIGTDPIAHLFLKAAAAFAASVILSTWIEREIR